MKEKKTKTKNKGGRLSGSTVLSYYMFKYMIMFSMEWFVNNTQPIHTLCMNHLFIIYLLFVYAFIYLIYLFGFI